MGQHAGQVLAQPGADRVGEGPRMFQLRFELRSRIRQPKGLEAYRVAGRVLAHQGEVAGVGDQHLPVSLPVAGHLVALDGQPGVVFDGLDLDHAALRLLPRLRLALLHLLGGVQAEVGMADALIGQLLHTEHLGLQGAADGVQQVGQRSIEGPLIGCAARRSYPAQVGEVRLNSLMQFPDRHALSIATEIYRTRGCCPSRTRQRMSPNFASCVHPTRMRY